MIKNIIGKFFIKLESFKSKCIYSIYKKKYNLNPYFIFNGKGILFYGDGNISVGNESYIGEYSTVQAITGCSVNIGNRCQISHNVRIYTSSDVADQDFSSDFRETKSASVIIGDYVWIGANVFINPGVQVGDNSIIGANSVVTKNVDSNTIVGGVPAKLIRKKQF